MSDNTTTTVNDTNTDTNNTNTILPEIQQRLDLLLQRVDDDTSDNSTIIQHNEANDIHYELNNHLQRIQQLTSNIDNTLDNITNNKGIDITGKLYNNIDIENLLNNINNNDNEINKLNKELDITLADNDNDNKNETINNTDDPYIDSTFNLTSVDIEQSEQINELANEKLNNDSFNDINHEYIHKLHEIDTELNNINLLSIDDIINKDKKQQYLNNKQIHYILTHPNITYNDAIDELNNLSSDTRVTEKIDFVQLLQNCKTTLTDEYNEFIQSRQVAQHLKSKQKKTKKALKRGNNDNDNNILSSVSSDDDDDDSNNITQQQRKYNKNDIELENMLNQAIDLGKTYSNHNNDENNNISNGTTDIQPNHGPSPSPSKSSTYNKANYYFTNTSTDEAIQQPKAVTVETKIQRMFNKMNEIQSNMVDIPSESIQSQQQSNATNNSAYINKNNLLMQQQQQHSNKTSFLPNISVRPPSTG